MNLASFQPRHSDVLFRRIKLEPKQTGGIIMPTGDYGNHCFGEVVSLGPGDNTIARYHVPLEGQDDGRMANVEDLMVGDTILIKTGQDAKPLQGRPNKMETTLPFTVNGEKLELVNEQFVIAVVTLGDST